MEPSLILGIETSCDETAAAVAAGRRVLSSVVASQVEIHARYGGVVPEVASRQHLLAVLPAVDRALGDAGVGAADLQAIAVTYGPGLAGSLLVGVNAAKGLALGWGLPLIGVNHLAAHIYANWAESQSEQSGQSKQSERSGSQAVGSRQSAAGSQTGGGESSNLAILQSSSPVGGEPFNLPIFQSFNSPVPEFPALCLIVSGGHTDLVLMARHLDFRLLGRTRDDAAGEAFDKAARLLGLGYPGGPAVERAAGRGRATALPLPRAWLRGSSDFSFSGLKTALWHAARDGGLEREPGSGRPGIYDAAASFQEAVVEVLVTKTLQLARRQGVRSVLLAGGVAANTRLRQLFRERSSLPLFIPPLSLCTDNAAMVAVVGSFCREGGRWAGYDLDVRPNLALTEGTREK